MLKYKITAHIFSSGYMYPICVNYVQTTWKQLVMVLNFCWFANWMLLFLDLSERNPGQNTKPPLFIIYSCFHFKEIEPSVSWTCSTLHPRVCRASQTFLGEYFTSKIWSCMLLGGWFQNRTSNKRYFIRWNCKIIAIQYLMNVSGHIYWCRSIF